MPSFDYKIVNVGKLEVTMNEPVGKRPATVGTVIVDGEPLVPTGRFWESIFANFSLNRGFFKFFSHNEVFKRIAERASDPKVRLCIERVGSKGTLLAVSNVKKPVLLYDDMLDILNRFDVQDTRYDKGVIRSTHLPRINSDPFTIAGDKFANRFEVLAPVDGYGAPDIYLSMLRLICSNGMMGFARAFRTTLSFLGRTSTDVQSTMVRALEAFNNEEGYAMLRERFEAAANSWASIRESSDLYHTLVKLSFRGGIHDPAANVAEDASAAVKALSGIRKEDWMQGKSTPILAALSKITGDPLAMFMSDPNKLTLKKQRVLPVACKVYDLINFATEVATHHTTEEGTRYLQAWVGGMLREDFDLEESCDRFTEFKDFFMRQPTAN